MKILFSTASVCPVCKQRVTASYMQYKDAVKLKQFCPEHGTFVSDVWRGEGFLEWCGDWRPEVEKQPACPTECGLCEHHQNQTCCAILDITNRCNLHCPFCFADGGEGEDMSYEEICAALDDMYAKGLRFIHISGGEPTVHPRLIDIIEYAHKKGFSYIQLNTNGLELAKDPAYAQGLSAAGLSCAFLQFDGTSDKIFMEIRGEALLERKKQAIRNCDAAELGVVLVPTIIPGINDSEIGAIIRFAYEHTPAIRGVHFQPVTYTGRFQTGDHFTMPEMLDAIEKQTGGMIRRSQILPSACDAPLCGFHAEFQREGDTLINLTTSDSGCCCGSGGSDLIKNQFHVKNRWTRIKSGDYAEGSFMEQMKQMSDKSFCISGMLFQDLRTLDLGRTMHCSVHVYRHGKVVPFCIYHNCMEEK